MKTLSAALASVFVIAASAGGETLAERLLADYAKIESVSCEVRREVEVQGKPMRTLSRVHYQRPDRLHVESPAPFKRRIVADGTMFYDRLEEAPRGFAKAIADLDEARLIQLRKVPGTAMDHLMRLKGTPEEEMEGSAEYPVRRGYASGAGYLVLALDAQQRLARIELFSGEDRSSPSATFAYSRFAEAVPGVWIPQLHVASVRVEGETVEERIRIENLRVNQPIAERLFDAAAFFAGVEWVDDFGKALGIEEEE